MSSARADDARRFRAARRLQLEQRHDRAWLDLAHLALDAEIGQHVFEQPRVAAQHRLGELGTLLGGAGRFSMLIVGFLYCGSVVRRNPSPPSKLDPGFFALEPGSAGSDLGSGTAPARTSRQFRGLPIRSQYRNPARAPALPPREECNLARPLAYRDKEAAVA